MGLQGVDVIKTSREYQERNYAKMRGFGLGFDLRLGEELGLLSRKELLVPRIFFSSLGCFLGLEILEIWFKTLQISSDKLCCNTVLSLL